MSAPLPSAEAMAAAEAAWIERAGVGGFLAQWYAHEAWEASWRAAAEWAASVMDGHGAVHCARLLRGGEGS